MPRIPLIEDLTTAPIPAGALLVEYDPASQWYNASVTIAAGWLRTGGRVYYNVVAQPPGDIRSRLNRLGLDTEALERENKLQIRDFYSATLGHKSKEKYAATSLKVADASIMFSKDIMRRAPEPEWLTVRDDISVMARFNDEKSWVEFELTRAIPSGKLRQSRMIRGIIRDVHSERVYKTLEAAHSGVIDFRLEEAGEETRNLVRIRSMRDVGFDSRWHQLKVGENFEVSIEK